MLANRMTSLSPCFVLQNDGTMVLKKVVRQTILGLLLFPVVSLKAGFACFILLPYIQRWCPDLGLPKSPNAKTFSKPN